MSPDDRRILDLFAARVRALERRAAIWAFGSRARGNAHAESDFDICVVVPRLTREVREAVWGMAWEIGLAEARVLTPIMLSEDDFERAPMSASTLVANIRREGIAA